MSNHKSYITEVSDLTDIKKQLTAIQDKLRFIQTPAARNEYYHIGRLLDDCDHRIKIASQKLDRLSS